MLGWKWEQQFYDNTQTTEIIDGYYDLKLKIYTQLAAELEALAALSQWFKIQINGTFQPFKLGGYAQMSYYTISRRTCLNIAYSIEDLNFNSVLNLRIGQCYKDIIKCFYNYDNWSSIYAKWLDQCQLSPATQTQLYSYIYQQEEKTNYL